VSRVRKSEGFALPLALTVLLVLSLLIVAAGLHAQTASDTALRDLNAKRAQQAADAGLRTAIYEQNALALDLEVILTLSHIRKQCIVSLSSGISVVDNGPASALAGNYCNPVSVDLGNGASYSYQTSPVIQATNVTGNPLGLTQLASTLERTIVSTGTAGGVTRRVAARLQAAGTAQQGLCLSQVGSTCSSPLSGNPVSGANITQLYSIEPGSYRQCPAGAPSGGDPSSNCNLPAPKVT
jgi:Tfp pilus assembly protein PilX